MKTRNIIIIISLFILFLPLIKADNYYCFSEGQQYSFCNPTTNYYRCGNYESCTCASNGGNCGPICMSEYDPIRDCYNQGSSISCNQGGGCLPGGTTGEIDQTPPTITLNPPTEGGIYNTRSVLFDIDLNENGDIYYYDNINGRGQWSRISTNVNSCAKKVSLKDGPNDLTIKAVDEVGNEGNRTVHFFVDSKAPKIKRTYPKEKGYANGEFTIEYTEENTKEISLFINGNKVKTKTNCPSDAKMATCIFDVNIGQYEGQEINYSFEIKDIVNNVVASKKAVKAKVDTVDPVFITRSLPIDTTYGRAVPFNLNLTEKVTIEYWDDEAATPKWMKLCSNCNAYVKTKTFNRGPHDLMIQATDLAGNSVGYNVKFNVDY